MSAADSDEIIAYWLLPAEPARSFFVSLIKELARRFDAPIFAPHLTIYAAPRDNSDPDEILDRVISKSETFKLLISGAQYSEEFTKTIFVQLEANDHLSDLSRGFSREAQPHHHYRLNPHLSLIYKTLPEATKKEIAASMEIPFSEITFDSAVAVICPRRTSSRNDVEAWRVVATQPFSPRSYE